MSQSKTQTIQAIYGAFARGDISAVVQSFVPQGEISFNVAAPSAPWHRPVKGHAELPAFFTALAQNVEFSLFEPVQLVEGPDTVAARVHMRFRVKSTGKTIEQNQVHWWSFDGDRIRSLVHYEDTAQVASAVRVEK